MITAGVDCGGKNTKTVILNDGRIVGRASARTGYQPVGAVEMSMESALREAGLERSDLDRIGGTGSGRNSVKPADTIVDEREAMGRGALYYFPGARTVIDVGAEEARAARLDGNGNVSDFVVNEKCAAGAGSFIEAMGRALETDVRDMGPLALESDKGISMNAQCAVFAESEVVGLIHANAEKKDISRAVHDAMAGRLVSMIRRIGVLEDVVMIGGVARNPGIVEAIKRDLKIGEIHVPEDPEYASALGAALAAAGGPVA